MPARLVHDLGAEAARFGNKRIEIARPSHYLHLADGRDQRGLNPTLPQRAVEHSHAGRVEPPRHIADVESRDHQCCCERDASLRS